MKYKYKLKHDVTAQTALRPVQSCVVQGYVFLDTDGMLFIYKGYAWDGATCAIDFKCTELGVLVHDALYQLIRESNLGEHWRRAADKEMRKMITCKRIANIYYTAVRLFGKYFVRLPAILRQ
jgi:hypothetical protein